MIKSTQRRCIFESILKFRSGSPVSETALRIALSIFIKSYEQFMISLTSQDSQSYVKFQQVILTNTIHICLRLAVPYLLQRIRHCMNFIDRRRDTAQGPTFRSESRKESINRTQAGEKESRRQASALECRARSCVSPTVDRIHEVPKPYKLGSGSGIRGQGLGLGVRGLGAGAR